MKNISTSIFHILLLTMVFLLVGTESKAQTPGTLDPLFGTNGLVITPANGPGFFYDMAVQADGKIVVVGNIGDGKS